MPPPRPPRKSPKTAPGVEQVASRRNRLVRGVSGLRVALDCLPLVGQQRTIVELIIREQEKVLATVESPARAKPSKQVQPKVSKTPLSREEQARRTHAGQIKKQQRAELDKKVRMVEAKQRAEREELHRKSGYSDFLRRVPGSFEGGKK